MESIASKGLEGSLDVVAAHDGRRGQLKVGSFEDLGEPAVDHCRTRARLWIGRIKAAMANKGRADLVMSREAPQKGIVTSGERRDKLLVDTAASRADVAPYGRHAAGRRVPDEIARRTQTGHHNPVQDPLSLAAYANALDPIGSPPLFPDFVTSSSARLIAGDPSGRAGMVNDTDRTLASCGPERMAGRHGHSLRIPRPAGTVPRVRGGGRYLSDLPAHARAETARTV